MLRSPPRQVAIRRVEFSENEQKFYDALWSNSKMAFEAMVAQGTALSNYAHVLELLLRVRQACDHPRLVIDHQKKRLEHEDNENETATTGPLRSSRRKSGSTKKSLGSFSRKKKKNNKKKLTSSCFSQKWKKLVPMLPHPRKFQRRR